MTTARTVVLISVVILLEVLLSSAHGDKSGTRKIASEKKLSVVRMVFFASPECERCTAVKQFIAGLKDTYPLSVKHFNIDRASDRAVFRSLEAIHAPGKFAVPLVLVGETILAGEDRITSELEPLVRRLARSGGAALPYLGQGLQTKPVQEKPGRCYECDQRGRPPDVRDELKRIRTFIDRLR